MEAAALPSRATTWLNAVAKIPFLGVLALAILLQIMRENYPFSHFPMYSVLSRDTVYYYLANGRGEPIPQGLYFGSSTAWTKKMFNSRLKQLTGGRNVGNSSPEEISEAGRRILLFLMEHINKDRQVQIEKEGLQLHQVHVERKGNQLVITPRFIAELPPR